MSWGITDFETAHTFMTLFGWNKTQHEQIHPLVFGTGTSNAPSKDVITLWPQAYQHHYNGYQFLGICTRLYTTLRTGQANLAYMQWHEPSQLRRRWKHPRWATKLSLLHCKLPTLLVPWAVMLTVRWITHINNRCGRRKQAREHHGMDGKHSWCKPSFGFKVSVPMINFIVTFKLIVRLMSVMLPGV